MFELAIVSWELDTTHETDIIHFNAFSSQKWIFLNLATTILFTILFTIYHWNFCLVPLIFTGGWLKFIECRTPLSIKNSILPYKENDYSSNF